MILPFNEQSFNLYSKKLSLLLIKHLQPEERLAERKRRSKPEFEAYTIRLVDLHSKNIDLILQGIYASQRKYLGTLLENEQIPISNNWNEPRLRNYAAARSTWLFADSAKGAVTSATAYTLVDSNEINLKESLNQDKQDNI